MGLVWRRRRRIAKNAAANVSTSGASVSTRRGPVTVSSRGRVSVRFGRGLSWRIK
jgi:hypothetical protein